MRVQWTRAAVQDLREAEAYIAADSRLYAQRFAARVLSSTRKLAVHPRIGRQVPEADDPDVRELIVHSYRVFYRIAGDSAYVLGVVHGARDLWEAHAKPWERG